MFYIIADGWVTESEKIISYLYRAINQNSYVQMVYVNKKENQTTGTSSVYRIKPDHIDTQYIYKPEDGGTPSHPYSAVISYEPKRGNEIGLTEIGWKIKNIGAVKILDPNSEEEKKLAKNKPNVEKQKLISHAIFNDMNISFVYVDQSGNKENKILKPLSITSENGIYSLLAVEDNGERKTYNFENIEDLASVPRSSASKEEQEQEEDTEGDIPAKTEEIYKHPGVVEKIRNNMYMIGNAINHGWDIKFDVGYITDGKHLTNIKKVTLKPTKIEEVSEDGEPEHYLVGINKDGKEEKYNLHSIRVYQSGESLMKTGGIMGWLRENSWLVKSELKYTGFSGSKGEIDKSIVEALNNAKIMYYIDNNSVIVDNKYEQAIDNIFATIGVVDYLKTPYMPEGKKIEEGFKDSDDIKNTNNFVWNPDNPK